MSLPVPDHLCWPVLRLYVEKGTSVYEVETHWTLGMVLDANEALDLKQRVEQLAMDRAKE